MAEVRKQKLILRRKKCPPTQLKSPPLQSLTGKTLPIHIILILPEYFPRFRRVRLAVRRFRSERSAAPNKSENVHLTLTANFPAGTVGEKYNYVMSVSGGTAPYTFWISSGSLPAGCI